MYGWFPPSVLTFNCISHEQPYCGVHFHLRISHEIEDCWECAWDAAGWEGALTLQSIGGSSTKAGKHFLPEPGGIRSSSTHIELPVWALQLSLMIYFKSIPAGGDRWLWVICVLNISRIHRECFSWVIDWWVTPVSYGAQLVYRFELNHTHMYCQQSISKNLLILSFPFTECHTA